MDNLILTGFMATGKSTVGRLLASDTGRRFVDLDTVVEQRLELPTWEIFQQWGEVHFRSAEHEVFQEILAMQGCIIATGGGTLVSQRNQELLGDGDTVVTLTCAVDELQERLAQGTERPLLPVPSRDSIELLLRERSSAYGRYQQIDTTGRTPEEVANGLATQFDLSSLNPLIMSHERSSRVTVRRGAADSLRLVADAMPALRQALIVTDTGVERAGISGRVETAVRELGASVTTVSLQEGENSKSLESLATLYKECLDRGLERGATVIGVGGGMICDIAGMLAATYMRGLQLMLVPTSLLAQVDASVGGKTAVDFMGAKNLVGSFYPADLVIVDTQLLSTLSHSRLSEGLAEVVKIAAVRSERLFADVEGLSEAADILIRPHIVRRAIEEKMRVVRDDPMERGLRALLNFGHTVGHALEAASGYGLSHGHSVSCGMVAEAWLGEQIGTSELSTEARLRGAVEKLGLPTVIDGLGEDTVFASMLNDKKIQDGRLRFAIPRKVGTGEVMYVDERHARRAVSRAVGAA